MEASLFDNLDVAALRALLGAGADSAVVDSAVRAASIRSGACVQLPRPAGVSHFARRRVAQLRQTPLHVNCKDGKLDCVAELLSHGANPNARDKVWTLAACRGCASSRACWVMLRRMQFGWTPLLAAVADKYLDDRVREDMVTLLLQHGADPTIVADVRAPACARPCLPWCGTIVPLFDNRAPCGNRAPV